MTQALSSRSSPRRRAANRASFVLVLVVLAGVWLSRHHKGAPDTSVADPIRSTVKAAITVDLSLNLPPATVPTADQIELQRSTGTDAINSFFTGAAAKQEIATLNTVIANQAATKSVVLGAGLSGLTFTSVQSQGTTASVVCTVQSWTKYEVTDPLGNVTTSEPHATQTARMTLTQNSTGRWLVSSYEKTTVAASGSQPPP